MKFIDEIGLKLSSGHGGPGRVSFRRESGVPRGGPDGGDGGRGGHVVIRGQRRLNTLVHFHHKKALSAEPGHGGEHQNKTGADGEDLVLEVPIGTIIKDKNTDIVKDILDEEEVLLLKGGRGGKGNSFFKNSVNQAPTYSQPGEEGQSGEFLFELSLLADVGIIGLPNVGKSTLISRLSAARPKIADYPFTTLIPNLGVVKVDDEKSFVMADIPGLIQGAHQGVGLGHRFLRHVQRTKILVHILDGSKPVENLIEDFNTINEELRAYDQVYLEETAPLHDPLAQKKQIVVLNKIDAISSEELEKVLGKLKRAEIFALPISAAAGFHLKQLIYKISEVLFDQQR